MGVLYARVSGSWVPITGTPTGDFVLKTGDTMTGMLVINRGPAFENFRSVGDQSYLGFFGTGGATRFGYLQHSPTGLYLNNEVGDLVFEGRAAGEIKLTMGGLAMLHVVGQDRVQADKQLHALALHTWGGLPATPQFGLTVDGAGIQTGSVVESTRQATANWTTMAFINNQQGARGGYTAYAPGYAPCMEVWTGTGERWRMLNNVFSGYCPISASSFDVNSTITSKRDVRSLRDRERINVHHPVDADVAPLPDVMALRPVAFRPKVPALRIVPTGDAPIDTHDPTTWRSEPDVGVLGHEGQRERLGLIAEEVQHVIPSAVCHDVDGNALGIDYAQITVALLDHVQRLTDEISTLRYRVAELEGAQ